MDKMNWKDDDFLKVKLADTSPAPKAIKEKTFDKTVTFVVKPKYGQVYRKTCPEFAKDIVENIIINDENTSRYFLAD